MTYEEFLEKFDLFNQSSDFLDESKSILEDFIYSNRACYFIMLSDFEEEAILFYSGQNLSRKTLQALSEVVSKEYGTYFSDDSFLFLSKMLKESYVFSDGIFLNYDEYVSLKREKKIYIRLDKGQEILNCNALNNLKDYEYVLLGKKILYVTSDDNKLEIDNVTYINCDLNEISNFNSWLEWFDVVKMKIMVSDFDVIFVNLGVFTIPICYFVSQNLHKIAIDLRRKLNV